MSQHRYHPRTLVINGDAINQGTATATTVANLFSGWPRDRLAQLYLNRREAEGEAGCLKSWRLDFVKDRVPGLRAFMQGSVQPKPVAAKRTLQVGAQAGHSAASTMLRGVIRKTLDLIPYRPSRALLEDIHAFAPEVVYSCISNIQLVALVNYFSRHEEAATVVHLMDDWLATNYTESWIWAWNRHKLVKVSRDLIQRCSGCIAISDKMAQEYETIFGRQVGVFMNCVELNGPNEAAPPDWQPGEPIRFVYVGGLHLGRWQSLLEIGQALDGIAEDGPHGSLIVHAPGEDLAKYTRGCALPRCLQIGGPVLQSDVQTVLRRADVLVHVESFGVAERRYTRLSVSTKIPQYMAAGRPVFCYGPGEVASCQFVCKNQCGLVVGSQEQSALISALRLILQDAGLRRRLGKTAWETAHRKFDAATVTEKFRSVLAEAAWGTRQSESPGIPLSQEKD
jgi:glycosyltransferase involved in cell wall biosynthesis